MPLKLPTFVFINAPAGAGKTTLQRLICEQDNSAIAISFAEPLRMALLGTFYPEQIFLGLDLRLEAEKQKPLEGSNISRRQWMISYNEFLEARFGPNVLGDLARRTIERSRQLEGQRFIFDDARRVGNVKPFGLAYGPQNCLLISIERSGCSWAGDNGSWLKGNYIREVRVTNRDGEAAKMLDQLAANLGTYGPPPASADFQESPL